MPKKRLSHEEFVSRVEEKYPGRYTFLGEYQGMARPIKLMYNECGHIAEPKACNIINFGRGCNLCSTNMLSHEQFVKNVEERYPGQYEFLSEYQGRDNKIHVKDLLCGLDWWIEARQLYSKNCRHPEYARQIVSKKRALTNEEFKSRFHDLAGDDYELLDDYKNSTSPMTIRHSCGCSYQRSTHSILYENVYKCPKCFPGSCKEVIVGVNDIRTTNPYLSSILKHEDDSTKYTQFSHNKAWFICPICGNESFKTIADVSTYGLGCKFCSDGISFGEKVLIHLLRYFDAGADYQFSPEWVNGRRYDFSFTKDNINYILEVDGLWHVTDNNMSGITAEEAHKIDEMKESLALEHGYTIIRIDYMYGPVTHNKEEYIKSSILNSELMNLFNITEEILDDIIFDIKINETVPEIVYKIAKAWNELDHKCFRNLKQVIKLSDDPLRKYVYKASELGLIKESKEDIKMLNRKAQFLNGLDTRAHYAICDQTGEILNYSEAREKYRAHLKYYFKKNMLYTGYLPDGTKLSWKKYENAI